MLIKRLHEWDVSYAEARRLQSELASRVVFSPVEAEPSLVAGLDCAFSKDGKSIFAAAVVLRTADFEVVETVSAKLPTAFPYIPGLLSFREAPVCLAAVEKLCRRPDLFMIDGQGIAHPRRLGLAAHLGLFFDRPTIGCAKSRLTGSHDDPQSEKGSFSLLTDAPPGRKDARPETIGAVVRTRTNVKCVYVSVGNRCTLHDAVRLTLAWTGRYRLPEPTRLAHNLVSRVKLED